MIENKFRMYFLVAYNLSPIQQGIQCGHAALEYVEKFGEKEDYKHFIKHDKTWIILNGGTSNHSYHNAKEGQLTMYNPSMVKYNIENPYSIGSMETHWNMLAEEIGVDAAYFLEPDANSMMTSIAFLVPNIVYNKQEHIDFIPFIDLDSDLDSVQKIKIREMYYSVAEHKDIEELYKEKLNKWFESLGGEVNGKLRIFLSQFRLA